MRHIIIAILVLFIIGCTVNWQTYSLADASNKQTIVLTNQHYQGHVASIKIKVEGVITGNATMSLILNGAPYKTENFTGNFDFYWGGDWYSDSAEIIYEPEAGTTGSITIKYAFDGL